MRAHLSYVLSMAALAAVVPLSAAPAGAAARVGPLARLAAVRAAPADITADIQANRDVTLAGDVVVTVPAGTTTYTGLISGEGSLTVAGTGRLVLTRDSDFTLPTARQRQKVTTGWSGDSYAVTSISDPDPPAVIVNKGATLQYGPGEGPAGMIGHYPYEMPGFQLNGLNIRVDGTLDVAVHRKVNLGIISGSGFIIQRRFTWDGISLAGTHPFDGVLYNGTGMDLGSPYYTMSMPNVKKILNQGSAIVGSPTGHRHVLTQDFYSREWGNDINFNFPLSQRALVVMTGVYSWADSGPDSNPSLSDPALNYLVVPHSHNKRGINIEGSNVQWGDGTHNRFFLPGNKDTVYINLHTHRGTRGRLTFDYNGPVTLSAPISGGVYHDTLKHPGAGDVVIAGTPGNAVTFAAMQNYDGSTTVGKGASLRLGTGRANADGGLLMSGDRCEVRNDGALVVTNAKRAISLARISGSGSFTQAGAATTTLTGQISYAGATTISGGTLALRGGSLARSSGVELTKTGATLDLTRAGEQTVKNLSGLAGTTVALGTNVLTVGTDKSTVYGGAVTGDGAAVTKVGTGTLTLTGQSTAAWTVREGVLRLGDADRLDATAGGPVDVAADATLSGAGTVTGAVSNAGTVATGFGATLRINGDYAQTSTGALTLVADAPGDHPGLTVAGTVTLAGRLGVADDALPQGTTTFTVVDNAGSAPVSGTFDSLPEGTPLTIGGIEVRISYTGGDGNDVVLTAGSVDPVTGGLIDALANPAGGESTRPAALRWAVTGGTLLVLGLILLFWLRRRTDRRRTLSSG